MIDETYDENYFKSINYTDYLSREDKYLKTAYELTDLLQKLSLSNKNDHILDYGCAIGFLIKGLEKLGFENVYGYDISSWAKEQAIKKDIKIVQKKKMDFNIIICLDVLEHMTDEEIHDAFNTFNSNILIARIPCSTDEGKSFHLDVSKRDKTHINCKEKKDWKRLLESIGYTTFMRLNLLTIYDSIGVMSVLCLKNGQF